MPYIQRTVSLLEVFNPRRRVTVLPQFDRRYLLRTARNLAAAISALHSSGYVAGDLNESNILVTPTALVTLIDTDSFQVPRIARESWSYTPARSANRTIRRPNCRANPYRMCCANRITMLLAWAC